MTRMTLLPDWRPGLRLLARSASGAIVTLLGALKPKETPAGAVPEIASGVAGKINLMPLYLSIPLLGATLLFAHLLRLRFPRAGSLGPEQVGSFVRALPKPARRVFSDLVLFYERVGSFVFYSAASGRGIAPAGVPGTDAAAAITCEVLVIGSGPGGAVTARSLARAGFDVLLVEEGPDTRLIDTPAYSSQEMDRKYRNAGLTFCAGRARIGYAAARCLGGGSEINSGFFHRIPESVLAEWRGRNALADLSLDALEPYYQDVVQRLSIGLLPDGECAASRKFRAGADRLGWASEEVPRWIASRRAPGGEWRSVRTGMTASFIADAISAGCRVATDLRIERLSAQSGGVSHATARRVNGHTPDARVSIRCKWVFVCAGAVGTPALLRRSGLRRNIGNSLQLHPMLRVVARFDETVNEAGFGVPVRQLTQFEPDLTLGCSASTLPHLALWMAGRSGQDELRRDMAEMAVFYALVRSPTLGRVRTLPILPDPLVSWSLASGDYDRLADGLRKLCELLFAAGARKIFLPMQGAPAVAAMDEPREPLARLKGLDPEVTAIHLFASCPLGGDAERFPLDPYGKLRDATNIFVNDASMLPTGTGVSPQGTVMAMALRNAQAFLSVARPGS